MKRPPINLTPIDARAKDGGYHIVCDDKQFAIARWRDDAWALSSGKVLDFEPAGYRRGA